MKSCIDKADEAQQDLHRFRGRKTDWLETISLSYLFLPLAIFFFSYLSGFFALLFIALLAVGLYLAISDSIQNPVDIPGMGLCRDDQPLWLKTVHTGALGGVLFLWLLNWSGWGWGHPVYDFFKHTSLLHDLVQFPWPLGYASTDDNSLHVLVAYHGFYLPAALIGKLSGWPVAKYAQLAWVTLGAMLACAWFFRLVGRVSFWLGLFFLLYGGLDQLGFIIKTGTTGPIINTDSWFAVILAKGVFLLAPNHLTSLNWGAHHCIPAWIAVLMVMYYAIYLKSIHNLFFVAASLPIWSAFVSLGTLPFMLAALYVTRSRGLWRIQNTLIAPLLLVPQALYFQSNNSTYTKGFLWNFAEPSSILQQLILFYAIAFALYWILSPAMADNETTKAVRIFFLTAIISFILFPLYRIGKFSDFPIKAFLPAMAILCTCWIIFLRNGASRYKLSRWAFIALLLIGTWCSAGTCLTQVLYGRENLSMSETSLLTMDQHAREFEITSPAEARQLFGRKDAPFWRYLAKPIIFSYSPQRH